MMKHLLEHARALRSFLVLWTTQSLSALGSAMTSFALVIWVYRQEGSALPAMLLSREGGGDMALGLVNTVTGLATLAGSLLVTLLPAPKSRVRVILNCLLLSMSTENFIPAFGRSTPVWCIGVFGTLSCLPFRWDKHIRRMEKAGTAQPSLSHNSSSAT